MDVATEFTESFEFFLNELSVLCGKAVLSRCFCMLLTLINQG